jgi:hypothetical protein
MEIVEIRDPADEKALEQFHRVATRVYREDPVWVPESERMFSQRYREAQAPGASRMVPVVALEAGQPVARGVAILAPGARDKTGSLQGWIGFVECVREYPRAAGCVLERCEQILGQLGAKSVLLPKVDNQLVGLLVKGFELPHMVFTNHNPPYYLELLESCGYEIQTNIYTLHFTRETAKQVHVKLRGFTTREFNRDRLSEEIALFHELQQAIFSDRPGYIRRTLLQDRELVHSFLPFLRDDLVIIAEDRRGNPVGLLVCLPDIYQAFRGQEITRARIVSLGAIPRLAYRGGIGALMGAHVMRNLLRIPEYDFVEGSWVLGRNVSPRNLARRFHAKPGREFVLLQKEF